MKRHKTGTYRIDPSPARALDCMFFVMEECDEPLIRNLDLSLIGLAFC